MAALLTTGEHPLHVLKRLGEWQEAGIETALVIITGTEGGAVRAPGALLAVNEDQSFGYISGGCIDADVVLQARRAMAEKSPKSLRYGAGSPFVDLPLPCGGAIKLQICPNPNPVVVRELSKALAARQPASLFLAHDGEIAADKFAAALQRFDYQPPLRLRIAGRGADALALASISSAAGYHTTLQLLDDDDIREARGLGLTDIQRLTSISELPDVNDDPWTAFVLLFHDRDLETPLLIQALNGPAFYIGAVGSRRTHAHRCEALHEAGAREAQIARIHGPIGLVPSLRDASLIAFSTLAEIIEAAKSIPSRDDARTAFILLAAGASSRFEHGDKLLADLHGQPVLHHAASLLNAFAPHQAVAVTTPEHIGRAEILERAGWTVITNPNADTGQASSIVCALNALDLNEIDQVLVLLADMPNVSPEHLSRVLKKATHPSVHAIMSESRGTLGPPALFKRDLIPALRTLDGDRGAKSVFLANACAAISIEFSEEESMDIDCVADLERASGALHA